MVRVLLDVDGVINAVPADHSKLLHLWGDIRDFKVKLPEFSRGLQIIYAQGVIDFLNQLADEGHEILWLTTWEERANKWICPATGLKNFPLASERVLCGDDNLWWKHEIAKQLWERDHMPFVWLDDDLGAVNLYAMEYVTALEWAEGLAGHCLPITPDTRVGLTPDHLVQVRKFIDAKNSNKEENYG